MARRAWIITNIFTKKKQPMRNVYEQWDLFGPLFICIIFGVLLIFSMPYRAMINDIIALSFLFYFIFGAAVGLNMLLLKGKSNILGVLCILSYMTIPYVLTQVIILLINVFKKALPNWAQNLLVILLAFIATIWTVLVSLRLFRKLVPKSRRFMGYYPVVLYIIVITCMQIMFCVYRGPLSDED